MILLIEGFTLSKSTKCFLRHTNFFVAVDVSLMIVKQPEQQHRARYQTEGSRGAVKDREGNGFPIVKLAGYYKPTTLQVSLLRN